VLLGVALAQVPLRHALLDAALLTLALVLVVRPADRVPDPARIRPAHGDAVFATLRTQGRSAHPARRSFHCRLGSQAPTTCFALAGLVVLASLASRGRSSRWLAPRLAPDA